MLFLGRILLMLAIAAGLGYGALFAIAELVKPEQREITLTIPTPPARPGS